uniref:Protein phosphatase 2c n=1 Tax=Rhizophora mucronata TaxID=61149 RepID=A0A2P2JN43_RHIMU
MVNFLAISYFNYVKLRLARCLSRLRSHRCNYAQVFSNTPRNWNRTWPKKWDKYFSVLVNSTQYICLLLQFQNCVFGNSENNSKSK